MAIARTQHVLVALADGSALAIGGSTDGYGESASTALASCERCDPLHTYTVLVARSGDDGRVHGRPFDHCGARYDAATNSWSATGPMATERATGHRAVLLPSGSVLVAGGNTPNPSCAKPLYCSPVTTLASTEIFDPSTNAWSPGPPMPVPRQGFAMVLLPTGQVLVSGGFAYSTTAPPGPGTATQYQSSLLFSEQAGSWTATGPLALPPGQGSFADAAESEPLPVLLRV